MANPTWFNKEQYLTSKLQQLRASGDNSYSGIAAVDLAITNAGMSAYQHFVAHSKFEGTSPNQYFNVKEYLAAKADQMNKLLGSAVWTPDTVAIAIREANMSAWDHFQAHGWVEGVNPSNSFDVNKYFESKLEQLQRTEPSKGWTLDQVKAAFQAAGLDPISHSIAHGVAEGVAVTQVAEADRVPSDTTGDLTFTLTANADNFAGTAGNDVFDGGLLNSFSAFDNLDGGAGNDTLNALTNAATVPGGVTVKNIENININHTGGAFAVDTSTFAGAQVLTLKNAAQAGNAITVNGTAAVTIDSNVVTGAATGGTISVGATTASTGAVVIKETASIDGGQAAGAITVKGGTSVSVTQVASNATAPILTTGANTTATQGAVTVTGTATTTDVTVNQTAAVTQVNTVVGVPAKYTVDFADAAAAAAGNTFSVGGVLVHTAAGVEDDAAIAAGAIATGNITVGGVVYTPTAGAGAAVVYTAQTAVTTTANGFAITTVGGTNATANGAVAPTTNGATAVTGVSGLAAGAVTITDVNAASLTEAGKITTVSLENFGAATINSGALASLTLAGKGTSVTETAGALTTPTATTLALNLNGATTGAVTLDADHTTLNIAAAVAASNLTSLSAAGAKAVNISGDKTVTLGNQTLDAAATITSTNTAGVTLSTVLGNNVTFTGGAGKDSVVLAASTKAINMGAGDDTVTLNGSALGVNGTVAGGEGRDTLKMTAANAITSTASTSVTNFSGKVTGFEVLEVDATAAIGEIKVGSLNNTAWNAIDTVTFAGVVGHATTVSGLVSGNTVGFKAANTAATTVALTNASAGTADVLNLSISNIAGINVDTINAADIETVNFLTDDAVTTTATGIQHTATLTAAAVTTITVAGDAGLALTNDATTVTSFDASAVTKGAVSWTTGILAAASNIKGGAGNDVIDAKAAVAAVTLTGGAGNDSLTGSLTKASTIDGGDGDDIIVGGNAADTINGGAGNDNISGGLGLDILTGGAGNDTFNIVANTNGNIYATIGDAATGDILKFADKGVETFVKEQVTLGGTAVYQDFLNEAAKGNGTTNGVFSWFQFGGDTYVVQDVSVETSFVNNADSVVKLTGLIDLTNAALGDASLTLA